MSNQEKICVLIKDGIAYYGVHNLRIDSGGWAREPKAIAADGTDSTITRGWLIAPLSDDGSVRDLIATGESRKTISHYTLRNPAAESVAHPDTIDYAEYYRREECDEEFVNSLYEPVWVDQDPVVQRIPSSSMLLLHTDAEPAPEHPGTWVAWIPRSITNHPHLHHLLPGHLAGFDTAAKACIEAWLTANTVGHRPGIYGMRGNRVDPVKVGNGVTRFTVKVWVPYWPHLMRTEPTYDRSGRKTRKSTQVVDGREITHTITVPDTVSGSTLAEATARWTQRLEELTGQLNDHLTTAVCAHCYGSGVVPLHEATESL